MVRTFKPIGTITTFTSDEKVDPLLGSGAETEDGEAGAGVDYDLVINVKQLTPEQFFKDGSTGLLLHYAFVASPFGPVLMSECDGYLTGFSFLSRTGLAEGLEELQLRWPGAALVPAPDALEVFREAMVWGMGGEVPIFHPKVWKQVLAPLDGYFQGHGRLAEPMDPAPFSLNPALLPKDPSPRKLVMALENWKHRWLLERLNKPRDH